MIAICSNTSVYVGVTIFTLVRSCRRVDRLEATRFLSATGVGPLIAVTCSLQVEFLCVVFRLWCPRRTAAKDALLLTSAKKHPTQFCFALRLQCDPLIVTVNEIAAYLQLPALSTELTVFYPGSSLLSPSASETWKCCSSHFSQVGDQQIPRGGPTRVSYVAVCTPSSSRCFV